MCGRYSLAVPKKTLLRRFGEDRDGALGGVPRFNIAPGQSAPAVRGTTGGAAWTAMRWGFPLPGDRPGLQINARIETLARVTPGRPGSATRRCLVPADGFFEWRPAARGEPRRPVRCRLRSGAPFAMAGLWRQAPPGEPSRFVVVTRRAAGPLAAIHPRMPLILPDAAEPDWLDGTPFAAWADTTRDPDLPDALEIYDVNPIVNRADRDEPACIEPFTGPAQGTLAGLETA